MIGAMRREDDIVRCSNCTQLVRRAFILLFLEMDIVVNWGMYNAGADNHDG